MRNVRRELDAPDAPMLADDPGGWSRLSDVQCWNCTTRGLLPSPRYAVCPSDDGVNDLNVAVPFFVTGALSTPAYCVVQSGSARGMRMLGAAKAPAARAAAVKARETNIFIGGGCGMSGSIEDLGRCIL